MLKQIPSRNQRSRGFKVKHFLQICLLIAIGFWVFTRFKQSYATKRASFEDDNSEELSQNSQIMVEETAKLGRKHLYPRVNELETKEEEIKGEDIEDDGHERDRGEDEEESEEVEDLIDVEDRDRDIGNEEQDIEDKANRVDQNKPAMKSQLHQVRIVGTEFETATLRKIRADSNMEVQMLKKCTNKYK